MTLFKDSMILLMTTALFAASAPAWAEGQEPEKKAAPASAPAVAPASAPASAPVAGPASALATAAASAPTSMAASAPASAPTEVMPPAEVVASQPFEPRRKEEHVLLAYLKAGGLIPVSKLSPNASIRLGVGYVPPLLQNRLGVVIDLGYSRTTESRSVEDPRLGESGGRYSVDLGQHDLNLFIGPQGFILDPNGRLVPYVAIGLDLHFLKTTVEGKGNVEPLGDNEETSTKVGFALRGGLGYRLGPGMLTGEMSFAWADLDHEITGDSNLGRFAILVGYMMDWKL